MNKILTTVVAMFIGGGVAAGSMFGLISSQTAAPDNSPVSVNSPSIDYGSNN